MIFSIPAFALSNWKQRTRLDVAMYVLRFDWNAREHKYFLTLLDVNEVPLAQGIKLVADHPFDLPLPGVLYVEDAKGLGRDPLFGELGDVFPLKYIDEDGVLEVLQATENTVVEVPPLDV